MKKNLKQALVPLAVMVFGAAAAFATNANKQNAKAPITAYHYDISKPIGQRCVSITVDCNVTGSEACTDLAGTQYWASKVENNSLLQCTAMLFRN